MENYLEGSLSHLLLLVEVWHVLAAYRKPCDVNILMQFDLTCDPSFKVK